MAGIKIHQYPLERFTFGDDDYYDIDYWDGAAYQTAKIKGSVLKSALAANLFTDDLTLSASRDQDLNSQQFKMRNGALQFGEVGAGLISSFLVESSNFDVRTADPLGDHTSLNIGGSGGTIQNISAGGSNIGKIQITGPSLSGVFTSGGVGPVVSANPSLYSVVNEDPGTGDRTTILQTHTDITQLSEDATKSTRIYQTKDTLQIANFLASGGGDQITLRWDNTLNNLVIEDDRLTKTGIEYYADYSSGFTARSLVDKGYVDANAGASELNDLTDVNTGLPVSPTTADDGKLLFYDHAVNEFITDDAVTHGTVIINGKKSTAGTIAKGTPVYLVGFDADLHTVEVADASSSATMPIIGLAAENMDDTNSKHITTFGKLTGVDTTATSALNPNGETWAVNDALYMSTTAGGFTKVRPTGGTTEIQRIAKVLKVDATGGQLFVFNTARTAGLPNLGTDKLWIGDANGIPQEVDKSTIGASIYTQDDTIGSGRVATLTDSLTFDGGTVNIQGANTLSTSTAFEIYDGDTVPSKLWDFRNNGDVVLGQSTKIDYGANTLTFGSTGSEVFQFNGSATAPTIIFGNGVASSTVLNLDTPSLKNGDRLDILNRLWIGELSGNALVIEPRGSASKTRLQGNLDLQGVLEIGNNYGIQTEGSSLGNLKRLATDFFGFTNYDDSVEIAGLHDGATIQHFWAKSLRVGGAHTEAKGTATLEVKGNIDSLNNRLLNTIINPTVQETTSTATLTINADQENTGVLTAQAAALTVANPTGTIVQGQKLVYRIKDNGTARAITWGANFRAIGVTLPTTTTASKLLYVGCIYNNTDSKWDVIAVNEEA